MSVDRYTKIVLTIIAASLLVIALDRVTDRATAANDLVSKVAVCNLDGQFCAGVLGVDGKSIGALLTREHVRN